MRTLTMNISGMTCGHCVKAVQAALNAVDGVAVESVAIGTATVRFDEALVRAEQVTQAVLDEGYLVTASN